MFFILFASSLVLATLTAYFVARFFDPVVNKMLGPLLDAELTAAWRKYIFFIIITMGISGGVRVFALEKYLPGASIGKDSASSLSSERWLLELFGVFSETLRSIAWVMLLFFLCVMMAHIMMKTVLAWRRGEKERGEDES